MFTISKILDLIDQVDTFSNPTGTHCSSPLVLSSRGLCAVSADEDDFVLACLGEKPGEIRMDMYTRKHTPYDMRSQRTNCTNGTKSRRYETRYCK